MKTTHFVNVVIGVLLAFCVIASGAADLNAARGEEQGSSRGAGEQKRIPPNAEASLLAEVNIQQKLGDALPLDAAFRDEEGRAVKLGDYFRGRPVVFALVYYQCPSLCNEVLNGMMTALKALDFTAGQEYEVVIVSFDPKETPGLAKQKRRAYLLRYGRGEQNEGWHFLTGDQQNITRVTESAGFNYRWDERTRQYAHGSGIMVATPEGKLSHYFLGIDFSPRDVRLALIESSNNKIGKLIDQFQLLCFHYDPLTGKYGLAIHRLLTVSGILTVVALGSFIGVLLRREKKRRDIFEREELAANVM